METNMPEIKTTPKILLILSAIYFFVSYFEVYLPGAYGPMTRYLIFALSVMFLFLYQGKIRKSTYIIFFVLWFGYKLISIAWSDHSNNDVSRTILSQFGMILLFISLCGRVHDQKLLTVALRANYWGSFLFGLLTLVFHRSYISEDFVARQVLTLFGRQNDPNNCAAFLGIGIAIAAYSLVAEKRMRPVSILLLLVNGYGIMLTGSRMGFLLIIAITAMMVLVPNTEDTFSARAFLRKLAILVVVLAVGIWIVGRFLPEASLDRMLAFDEYSEGSGRAVKWSIALQKILERPLFGWGWGGYSFIGSVLHNTYLTILCDGGIVGLTLFLIPVGTALVHLAAEKYQLGVLILITGLLCAFFLDAINKRFLWNTLIIAIMLLERREWTGSVTGVWAAEPDDGNEPAPV